jgi:hypothetical protein
VIDAGDLMIDPTKVGAVSKRPTPTNVIEMRSLVGTTQYLTKFIASFFAIVVPLYAVTMNGWKFHSENNCRGLSKN